MRAVVQPQKGSPCCRRQGRRLAAARFAAHAAALLAATLLLASSLPRHVAADREAGHDCPQYGGNILDLPDTSDCRRLLSKLSSAGCLPHYHAAVIQEQPGEACCRHASNFFSLQCHCWSSQFDREAVAAVAAVDAACTSPHLDGAAGSAAQQAAADAGAGSGIQLTRLRERAGTTQQQEIHLGGAGGSVGGSAGGSTHKGAPDGIHLFVGVLSAGGRRAARDAIRATWGAHPAAYRVRFFLARPPNDTLFDQVRAEAVEKRDMVVLGHILEHYHNITHQTLEVLRMAAADPQVTHVLKVDDDSYVHFDRLMHRLESLHKERVFLGYIENPGGRPHREPNHQWYVSKEEWPSERYPPWAHGAGYVLTADLVAELASGTAFAASQGGHLFKLEDIALAGWLEWAAQQSGLQVHLVVDKRFNFNGCASGDLVSHYIKPEQQRCMWEHKGRCRCS